MILVEGDPRVLDIVTVIGPGLTVIGLIAGYYYFTRQRKVKRLICVVFSRERILLSGGVSDLTVFYKDQRVENPALTVFRLVNIGNVAIESNHFTGHLHFVLPGAIRVVAMDLLRVKPDGLEPDLEVNSNRVTLKPLLLNVQDALEIQVLTEGLPSTVQVQARILEVPSIVTTGLPYSVTVDPRGVIAREEIGIYLFFLAFPLVGFPALWTADSIDLQERIGFTIALSVLVISLIAWFFLVLRRVRIRMS
jgi:hypothetical protein